MDTNTQATEIPADVIMDHATAMQPKSEWAQKLAAEAQAKAGEERKQGGIKDLAGRADLFRINPYLLKVKPGWNSREANDPENIAHIDWLARSIASEGVLQPLTVFWEDGAPVVEDGHCRLLGVFRAIEVYGAEIKSVPVQVTDRHRSEAERVLSQLNRNSGKQLTPYEASKVYARLHRLGWTIEEIAERTARSKGYIEGLLQLQAAPQEVKQHVATGAVSTTLAVKVLKDHDGDGKAAAEVLDKAVQAARAKGKERATERHVRATGGAKPPAGPATTKPATPSRGGPGGRRPVLPPHEQAADILQAAEWVPPTEDGGYGSLKLTEREYIKLRQLLDF